MQKKGLNMLYVSAINNFNKTKKAPTFGAEMNAVRYVIVDGQVTDDKTVIEKVTKEFVKTAREGSKTDPQLKQSIKKAIPEFSMTTGYQNIKFLKLNMLGKEFNIIMGSAATALKNIWNKAGMSLADKKKHAGDIVRRLIYDKNSKHLAIEASTQKIKGKVKYIIKNIFITI